jgi:hypothetical protein
MASVVQSVTSVILRKHSTGYYVTELKKRLNALGAALPAGDTFDAATHDAVVKFQQTHTSPKGGPLEADGIVGPDSWKALGGPPEPRRERANQRGYQIMSIAMGEYMRGVREQGGNNRGADVEVYQRVTGMLAQAWCASFVSWCYSCVGIPLRDAHGFAAVAELKKWARGAGYWRQREPGYIPPCGAIVIYTFSHTGIVVVGGEAQDSTVEGNTGPGKAGSQRDGDGVYYRTRSHGIMSGYVVLPQILLGGA